jgi:hypothetical protein
MRHRFLLLLLIFAFNCKAQNTLTENFAFNVKSIDDFIDRFNFTHDTEFEKYFFENYPADQFTRRNLIYSLFNLKNNTFSADEVKEFIDQVTDSEKQTYFNFYDASWYAEAECKVIYKNKPQTLLLVLEVSRDTNNSFKWSIVTANAAFLGKSSNDSVPANETIVRRSNDSSRYFLHPVSHALQFMNIDRLFSDNRKSFDDYLYDGPHSTQLNKLIEKTKNGEIKFVQVNTISYHLLQIAGWIVVIDYFNRNEKNSGWLINRFVKASENEKNKYLNQQLNVPVH